MRRIVGKALDKILEKYGVFSIPPINEKERTIRKEIIDRLRKNDILLYPYEAFFLYSVVKSIASAYNDGIIVEVGCYKGGSSELICIAKGDKPFFAFDTFNGIPDEGDPVFHKGRFKSSYEEVKERLNKYSNVEVVRGDFRETYPVLEKRKILLAHIDTDTFASTKFALSFFIRRSTPYILLHDYPTSQGVVRAVRTTNTNGYVKFQIPARYLLLVKADQGMKSCVE